ncbi:MAG: sigma-E factor negative regulatory protein [Burkholderiaceae bacterium]
MKLNLFNEAEHEAAQLSALADGELGASEVASACANWRTGASCHATWHTYHLIGDVLRSDDLASSPAADRAMLEKLRERLQREPVILAPEPVLHGAPAARSQRTARPWTALAAVAAGFAAVAGVLIVLGGPSVDLSAVRISLSGAAPASFADAASRPFEPTPQPVFADGRLVRDARLDRYLDAHKHFSGVSALGVPSTFLRGATSDASNR